MIRKALCLSFALAMTGVIGYTSLSTAGGCGCGSRTTRSAWGGHSFGRRAASQSAGMAGCGMNMSMPMAGMSMPATQAPVATATTGTVRSAGYTCPMHPNVVSATPGACPVCKMALVAK